MKKLAIIVVIIALGGIAIVGGYSIKKEKLKTNININVDKQNSNNTSSALVNNDSNGNSESSNNSIKNTNNNSVNNTYNQNADNISSQVNTNNSSSSTSKINSNNENKTSSSINISDYMGVWNPVTEVQWNGVYTKNIIPTQKQLNDNKLIMTPEEFSFNGVTIKNPVYKIVPVEDCDVFANAHMGAYQGLNNNYTNNKSEIGIPKTPYSPLYFIVAYPKGKSKEYLSEGGAFILNYPYILDGHVFALVNTPEQPLYKFEK